MRMRWAQGRLDLALLCFAGCSLHVHVFRTIGPFCELHRPKGPWQVPTAGLKSLRAALASKTPCMEGGFSGSMNNWPRTSTLIE
jgi:hypothetical protein